MSYQSTVRTLPRSQEKTDEPSVSSAFERVLDASERVIVDRIDLMRLDVHETVVRTLRATIFVVLGGMLLCAGWCAAMAIVMCVLNAYGAPAAGYTIVACLSLGVGAALVALGMQRLPRAATRLKNGASHG